jgi:hypothetical protein
MNTSLIASNDFGCWILLNGATLFLGASHYPPNGTSVPPSFIQHIPSPYIKTETGPDVHFDGPKMDEKGFGFLKRT